MQAALAIDALAPGDRGGLLLRGHALHSLHRFGEAELIARRLVRDRGASFDHGLLGDVLSDRGELAQAIESYQRMMDLRPDMHAYVRAAHVRYLTGDLRGAITAIKVAARAASPRNRDSFAWTWSKLAGYQLQAGELDAASDSVQRALAVQPGSYHALRAQAQLALAESQLEAALGPLMAAAQRVPHPDLLWMLQDVLEALGRHAEARAVAVRLRASGESEDPRALALYLAAHDRELDLAARLAGSELEQRPDIYSHEALGLVRSARGEHAAALEHAQRMLASGASDPRLHYHAGLIALRAGDARSARQWLEQAEKSRASLLPSQRADLAQRLTQLMAFGLAAHGAVPARKPDNQEKP